MFTMVTNLKIARAILFFWKRSGNLTLLHGKVDSCNTEHRKLSYPCIPHQLLCLSIFQIIGFPYGTDEIILAPSLQFFNFYMHFWLLKAELMCVTDKKLHLKKMTGNRRLHFISSGSTKSNLCARNLKA